MKDKQKSAVTVSGVVRAIFGLCVTAVIVLSPWWLCTGPLSDATRSFALMSASYSIDGLLPQVSHTDIPATQTDVPEQADMSEQPEPEEVHEPDDTMPSEPQPTEQVDEDAVDNSSLRPVVEKQYGSEGVSFDGVYVRNGSNGSVDIEALLSEEPDCKIKLNAGYQVLIMHTHTTECYGSGEEWYDPAVSPRTTDLDKSVVQVGEAIASRLEEAGIRTLHITEMHDYPNYNGAYTRAAETISEVLAEHPSIEMVIDVHRDCIEQSDGTRIKPTAVINGKRAAQVMILNGCCEGKDLEFDSWQMNLRMGLRLQRQLGKDWPGLARSLYVAPFRYNMQLTPNSMIVEVGSDVNTLDEAVYSGDMVGQSLAKVLLEYVV
ncbi:MAG: stage II sporulation protein P [Clostridia bacterium]|nr:stage II sporulation protein P [Clostridia bacterium]